MRKALAHTLAAALVFLGFQFAAAGTPISGPNWSREKALEAVGRTDTRAMLDSLLRSARAGHEAEVLAKLERIGNYKRWSGPVRDHLLYRFAVELGDLPAWSVGEAVLDRLATYRPTTLVPHQDHPQAGVPLYNVRAAAFGAGRSWERAAGREESLLQLRTGGDAWLDAYLASGPGERHGFLDTLDHAGKEPVRRILERAAERLEREPDLWAPTARTAVILRDPEGLAMSIRSGGGPQLTQALREAARTFDGRARLKLLQQGILATPEVAAVAIAELGPGLLGNASAIELLFTALGDPVLGAPAALMLSKSRVPPVRERLIRLAGGDEGLASGRAALALEAMAGQNGRAQR